MSAPTSGHFKKVRAVDDITFTTCMEQLQEAYVTSIASTAGCIIEVVRRDLYGMDVSFLRPNSQGHEESILWAQLKNTTTIRPDAAKEHFSYRLKKRRYLEALAKLRSRPKAVLLVMVTDPDQSIWAVGDHDMLAIRNCCYWTYIEGHAVDTGVESPTVNVPTRNIFDAAALTMLMDTLGRGNPI